MKEEDKAELINNFHKIAEYNGKEDWNHKVFRETIANAFLNCALNHIYKIEEREKKMSKWKCAQCKYCKKEKMYFLEE